MSAENIPYAAGPMIQFWTACTPVVARSIDHLRICLQWAWLDTICRYRRSKIGPLWDTINVLVMTVGLVVVSSAVIGGDTKDVIGFVALGIIVWTTITSLVTEGASAFSRNAELIINSNIRTDCYIGKALFTTLIIFCHHIILYFLAVVLLLVPLSWTSFLAIPGIVLLFANGYWLVVVLAFLCARFKDIEPIIRSLLQVGFFVTPVFWNPNIIATGKPAFVNYNLLYYFIEIVRSPLLGHVPPLKYYAIVTACTLVGYAIAFLIYRQMRARLAFVV